MTTQKQIQDSANRYGREIAARLNQSVDDLPYDITERLRAARMQAMANRKSLLTATAPSIPAIVRSTAVVTGGARNGFGGDGGGNNGASHIWQYFGSVLPLLALVAGLIAIDAVIDEDRANEVADVDSALLTDDLPPSAYSDPGFLQFLRVGPADATSP